METLSLSNIRIHILPNNGGVFHGSSVPMKHIQNNITLYQAENRILRAVVIQWNKKKKQQKSL